MEYAYPPPSPLRPVPVDYANWGMIGLCGLTAVVLIVYCNYPKQRWLIGLFFVLPLLGGALLPFLYRSDPDVPPGYGPWIFLLMLSGAGLFVALVRSIGLTGAFVIVLIASFFFLMAPREPRGRRRPLCLTRIRNVLIAIHNYAYHNAGRMPDPGFKHSSLSWRISILPLIDHAALYNAYHRDKPWDDSVNDEFAKFRIASYQCPDNLDQHDVQGRYYTAYAYFTGPGTAFDDDRAFTIDEIAMADGTTSTILLGEACGANIVWNEPRDIDVGTQPAGVNLPGKTPGASDGWLSSYHADSANVAFADGSTRTISNRIDPKVLKALTTVDGDDTPLKDAW